MKIKIFYYLISVLFFICLLTNSRCVYAQKIPYGISSDSIKISFLPFYIKIYYYKPLSYDSIGSPILTAIHGVSMDGMDEINDLKDIADRRKALIVAPEYGSPYGYGNVDDLGNGVIKVYWDPTAFKEIYRHVINREQRDSMWVYLIGFSAGGQCVTRYMLIRQTVPDSIPIRMAVSCSPLTYTFPTDEINGTIMPFFCGLYPYYKYDASSIGNHGLPYDCDSKVIMYYNENYGVLIGTNDVGKNDSKDSTGATPCISMQGSNRYERAQNFYAFAVSDAVNRGAVCRWKYAEVLGVGHNEYPMYNTKALPSDTFSIAENMLFNSPYSPNVVLPPFATIKAEISEDYCNIVNFRAPCIQYIENTATPDGTVLWDFGDSITSTDPTVTHVYQNSGNYLVTLTINSPLGSDFGSKVITIKETPISNFTADTTITYLPDATVHFQNNSSVDAKYFYWDFGDSTTSTDKNPVHTYLYPDTFTVQLIAVGENGCANKLIKENYVIATYPNSINDLSGNNIVVRVYPNPFKDNTTISFAVAEADNISIDIYNSIGVKIKTLFNQKVKTGQQYNVNYSTENLSAGMYFCIFQSSKVKKAEKLFVAE